MRLNHYIKKDMAISVDKVYKTVLSILNKESRGFLTPDEFNKIGSQVQLDILDQNFYEYNRAVIKHNAGRAVEDYGNIPEKIEQKIDPFFKQADITLTNGIGTLPTDLYKTINISITNKTIQLEKVDKKSLSYLLSSPLTKPTTSFPVYYQRAADIIVEPALSDGSWTLGDLLIEYIKIPDDVVWGSEADTNGALTHKPSDSVDYTLHESDRVQLILGILKYAGLVISDPAVIQVASAEENKITQLEQ
mgnify:CR=1 FL=1|tara:strand:+ start:9864 stop:10607 length:744 start_codon:yes stop_codon:yes gene_type:complete